MIVHHVFFWLRNPAARENRERLINGLNDLRRIETVREMRIGIPAPTEERTVVDATYDVSELMLFDDTAGHDAYQVHPIHKKFVEECEHLWARVVVYDSMDLPSGTFRFK